MTMSDVSKPSALGRWIDTAFGLDFPSGGERLRSLWHFYMVDHGLLRTFWTNLDEIAPGVWRSNQPSPRRLRRYKGMGIDTVLNLRGESDKSHFVTEQRACAALGIQMVQIRLRARDLVRRRKLLKLLDIFETIDKPFVMHCKSGADRAGLASALYLLHIEGRSVAQVRRMLSLRYVHIRATRTGILDFVLDRYAADTAAAPMPIREWIETCYGKKRLKRAYRHRGKGAGA